MPSRARERTRERLKASTEQFEGSYGPGLIYGPFGLTHQTFSRYERIRDVVGSRGSQNPVKHIRLYAKPGNLVEPGTWHFYVGEIPAPLDHIAVAALLPVVPEEEIQDFCTKLLKKAETAINQDTSIINMLLELRKGIGEIIGFLGELLKFRFDKAFLGIQFGTNPFLQDLKKLLNVVSRVQKRLEFLKKTLGKTFPCKSRREFGDFEFGVIVPLSVGPVVSKQDAPNLPPLKGGSTIVGIRLVECTAKLSGTVIVKNDLSFLDGLGNKLDSIMHALGVDNPLKILWNAIPWSWLVDWFVNIEEILDLLGGDPLNHGDLFNRHRLIAVHASHSAKLIGRFEVVQKPEPSSAWIVTGEISFISYSRANGLDLPPYSFWNGKALTLQQYAILGALATSRLW